MAGEASYHNVTATVRPPRCAVLINKTSEHWMAAVHGTIRRASEMWGGKYFVIIPTDGDSIEEKFWELLEGYSPDFIVTYKLTYADLKFSDPERYEAVKRRHEKSWKEQGNPSADFEEWFTDSASQSYVEDFRLSDELEAELVYRLSPFHHKGSLDMFISCGSGFGYPLTEVAKIVSTSTNPISGLVLPHRIDNPTLSLLVSSQTGLASDHYVAAFKSQDFTIRRLPDDYGNIDLLRLASGDSERLTLAEPYAVLDDSLTLMPFSISMLNLGQYYRADARSRNAVTIVLGDTVDDFCLYYSLSRVRTDIYWLPLAWLRKCYASLRRNDRLRKQGQPTAEYGEEESAARVLVNLFYDRIQHGYSEKKMQLCSFSLSGRQLVAYKAQMARCSYSDPVGFRSNLNIISMESVSAARELQVFENDNYANRQDMIFVDGNSVGFLNTPRPKNFSEIRLPGHYWLTSVEITNYGPPSLADLGPKIVNLHDSTTESRVAADGIVYLCPNSIIFNPELDATLRRPMVQMPDTMALIQEYFRPVGVTVEYSDKGNYFIDTLRRFGGLDEVGTFIKAPTTRSILDKFKSKKTAEQGRVIYLENDQRTYINIGAIAASLGDEDAKSGDAVDLVDTLVGKEVLQRGYIFRCERCRLTSWYNVNDLTAQFMCNRCGHPQQFTKWHWKEPAQPHWYYKLAETIYQFYINNSDLVAQVLYKLKSESKRAFHFAPEIDLVGFPTPGKNSKSREMDVACILDGQLIFGECKTESLKLNTVDKFDTLVGMPIKNPARVVFATTKAVSSDFKERVATLPQAQILTYEMLYDN
ncbi:hypothetical protein [Nocardia aurea]|uniref:hypothetical protein n=1 Tax=Nocardia aurea TaxID=2144174 RepID=UPI00130059AC|nr:hypothetical protein [Nocardia aurea]